MEFSVQITGAKEIEAKLLSLERKFARTIVKDALREGANHLMKAMKGRARTIGKGQTGMGKRIANALAVRVWRRQYRGVYGLGIRLKRDPAFVGYAQGSASSLKSKKLVQGRRYFIPTAIEYGHAFPGRGGRKGAPKDVPARPFARPAIDAEKGPVERIINRRLLDGLYGL